MSDLIFDVDPAEKNKYVGWCILNPKYKTFMIYSGYDKQQRYKTVGAFNTKDDNGEWHAVAKNVEILKACGKIRGPIALDKAASDRFKALNGALEGSRASDADIDIPCPDGLAYLPFQKAGIKYALDKFAANQKGILYGDEMGLGKSVESLGLINAMGFKRVIVVCPASLKINWLREARKWLLGDWNFWVANSDEGPSPDHNFCIINYERLDKYQELAALRFDLVIFDESHKNKSSKAKRTKLSYGYWDKTKKERISGLIDQCQYRLCLSGTALLNRPVELWTTICALAPGQFGSFRSFADKFCGAYEDKWAYHVDGATNLPELQLKLRQKFMIRRLKKDVLKELPPKVRQIIEIAPNGCANLVAAEQAKWSQFEDQLEDIRSNMDLAKASGNKEEYERFVAKLKESSQLAFTDMSAVRHKLALSKAPYVVEHAINVLENVEKIVLFAWHSDVIEVLREGLKEYNPVVLTGETKQDARQQAVDDFQTKDNVRVFIGNIQAAGEGHTLHAGHVAIFAELSHVPAHINQAEDRLHRIGQVDTVLIHHLVIDGSFDALLAKTLVEKQHIIDAALDNPTEIKVPVIPQPKGEQLSWICPEVPDDMKVVVHAGIRQLATMCDGARVIDTCGFNKFDTRTGKFLAACATLTNGQAVLAAKLVRKYRRQLGGESNSIVQVAEHILALKPAKA